jgi:hypothetical protein
MLKKLQEGKCEQQGKGSGGQEKEINDFPIEDAFAYFLA